MKEPCGEGPASHTVPESCVVSREAEHEALTGVYAGGIKPRKPFKSGCQGSPRRGKATSGEAKSRASLGPCEVEDPRMYRTSTHCSAAYMKKM